MDFLFELSAAPGVSGYETAVADIVIREFSKYCDNVTTDSLGNVIAHKKGNGKHKIMFAAHMDEIGLIVTEYEKGGFLRFDTIGGFDQRALASQEVLIHTKNNGAITGIIGVKPPHITSADEAKKAHKLSDMSIDTGFSDEKLKEVVSIGDICTIKRAPRALLGSILTGKAFDDRAGIAALFECMKNLDGFDCGPDVYFVASVQEEVHCRGAKTAAYQINPDIGIAVDVTHGKTPDVTDDKCCKLGAGAAVGVGTEIHPRVFEHLKNAAKQNFVPYQIEVLPGRSGTDAHEIQVSAGGVCTGVLSIPLKYMHTSVETIDWKDVEAAGKLMSSFITYLSRNDMEELLCL